jgi:hypothetical protein
MKQLYLLIKINYKSFMLQMLQSQNNDLQHITKVENFTCSQNYEKTERKIHSQNAYMKCTP